jgi:hypothetical protein
MWCSYLLSPLYYEIYMFVSATSKTCNLGLILSSIHITHPSSIPSISTLSYHSYLLYFPFSNSLCIHVPHEGVTRRYECKCRERKYILTNSWEWVFMWSW